ncbi:MAG: hypothetical protein FWD96_05615, partial [Defluviitaleaceae bacterium]|nr:hypothetical protein [Defluviitaleaceae bacterium]
NARISREEVSGDHANDFRDQRNLALDELATLIPIMVREDSRGNVEIRSGNHPLLSGGVDVNRIGLKQTAPASPLVIPVITNSREILDYDAPHNSFRPLFALNDEISPQRGTDAGRLLGLIVARGLSDENAYSLQRAEDLRDAFGGTPGWNGVPLSAERMEYDRIMFNFETAMIPRTMIKLDTLFNHVVTMLNDAISPKIQVEFPAGSGNYRYALDVDKVPYNWNGDRPIPPLPLFVRNYQNGEYLERFERVAIGGGEYLYLYVEPNWDSIDERGTLYTLGNVSINPAFTRTEGHSLLALSPTNAHDDTTLVLGLMELWKNADITFPGVENPLNLDNAYRQLVTSIADQTNEAMGFVREQTTLVSFIDNRRQSVKGVSMDEELSMMLVFQHSYNANARMVNMIDSMLETIINLRR